MVGAKTTTEEEPMREVERRDEPNDETRHSTCGPAAPRRTRRCRPSLQARTSAEKPGWGLTAGYLKGLMNSTEHGRQGVPDFRYAAGKPIDVPKVEDREERQV